jgi:hypothetical protein
MVWDPGYEIQDPEKTYPGFWMWGSKRHRIPDPQHCLLVKVIVSEKIVFLLGQEASRLYRNFQRDAAPLRQPDVHHLCSLSNRRLST